METPSKLIKYHQLARPENRASLIIVEKLLVAWQHDNPVKLHTDVLPQFLFSVRPDCAQGRARPTNGSDRGSLRSHDLTLFVRCHCAGP